MGKSSNSCFKIIGCGGGDAVDDDDLLPEEAKASSDKRRWSFRKRSSRNQVLSNSVISDPISVCSSKQTQDVLTSNLHSSKYALPEKPQKKEKPIEESPFPSNIENTEAPPSLSSRSTTPVSPVINESDVVIIQTAIRGYLARKMLRKLKSVVKLQAAVRGHLVRRQAFGTLRCIQAIIRMQALVRARRAQLVKGITFSEETKFQGKGDPIEKSSESSIKKLLSNGLARQLLANTPTPKIMYLKCDPSKSDSAWKWLERWMAVTSSGSGHESEQNFNQDGWEVDGAAQKSDNEPTKEIPCAVTVFSDMKAASAELVKTDDDKNSVIAENIGDFEFQTSVASADYPVKSSLKNDGEDLELQNEGLTTRIEDYTDTEMLEDSPVFILDDKALPLHLSSETILESEPEKVESAKDTAKHSKRNPAFAAAQAKFEELSSVATVDQPASTANENVTSNSKRESNTLEAESFTDNNEANPAENLMLHDSRIQAAGSECGTEISISSTLDSLDRSEMEGGEIVIEIGAVEKQNYSISFDAEKVLDISDRNGTSDMNEQTQRPDASVLVVANTNDSISVVLVDQNPTEPTTSAVQNNLEVTTEQARSPEGTPRSHGTVPDPHGTPSSETSTRSKKSKKDHNTLTHKQRSHSVGKRSPSNPNNDSGVRSSTEIVSNDPRIQKRRNSFGISKPDHVDQEPRLSSSNSLPGYMQATASARAKAHTSQSQKCSPDLLDNQLKKRHSLPIENGKQSSSPRIQRSASQALQSAKGNGVHSPQNSAEAVSISERRWQR